MSETGSTTLRALLAMGYFGLGGSALVAHGSPASGYEYSLYGSTPLSFWLLLAVAFLAAVAVGVSARATTRVRGMSFVLAALAMSTVPALPILRGYYFYGPGDSLSHLGWAREIASGALSPWELLYPGVHSIAIFYAELAGVSLRYGILYAVFTFFLVFLTFVPLCVRLLTRHPVGTLVGVFSAVLLMPINNIAIHSVAHPSSQAVLFAPVCLFLALLYVGQPGRRAVLNRPTGIGALLALSSVTIILVHPQQAVNVAAVFVSVAMVQFVARNLWNDHSAASHRPMYVQAAFICTLFFAWAPRFSRVSGSSSALISNLLGASSEGSVVASKSTSLTAVGGSVIELFVKLFLTSAIFVGMTGLVALVVVWGVAVRRTDDRHALYTYFTASLAPLSVIFFLFFLGGSGDMYFRYEGFLMMVGTVLGGLGIAWGVRNGVDVDHTGLVRVLVGLFFLVALPLAVASVHPSPYIYQSNAQVTEAQYAGYETSFEYRMDGVQFTGIRGGPRRFVDAVYGTQRSRYRLEFPGYEDRVPAAVFNENLSTYYDETRYMAVGDTDYTREVRLYHGLRYKKEGFDRLDSTPGIARVHSNGQLQLYLMEGNGE